MSASDTSRLDSLRVLPFSDMRELPPSMDPAVVIDHRQSNPQALLRVAIQRLDRWQDFLASMHPIESDEGTTLALSLGALIQADLEMSLNLLRVLDARMDAGFKCAPPFGGQA